MRGALLLAMALLGSAAAAHPQQTSAVIIDIHGDVLALQVLVPVQPDDAGEDADDVAGLVAAIAVSAPDGRPFVITAGEARTVVVDGVVHHAVNLVATPPLGAHTRAFTLTDAAIDRLRLYVELRHDFAAGRLDDAELIGVLSETHRVLVVDRGTGSWSAGFGAVFELGMDHIAEGTDHLLFLLVLLLPSTLIARGGRWREVAAVDVAVKRIAAVVTAFTVGHSITLALAATQLVQPSTRVVESIVALSIFVSALQALRPLGAGREVVVAAGFGLVHGLAFATTLTELGVHGGALAVSVLAFNLGIEVMQLAIVVITMPWLLLLSRTPAYPPLRIGVAVVAAIAAAAWGVERVFDVHTPVSDMVEAAALRAPWGLLVLAVGALLAFAARRRRQP